LYEFARGESVEIAEVDAPKFVRTGLFVRG
jgi:hypothetical protein